MEKTQRISQRLPDFYRVWDSNSVLYKFIDAAASNLAEAQQDAFRIMKTHWVDTAFREDLDRIGALLNTQRRKGEKDSEYKARLKMVVSEFKGGGTISAILKSVRSLLNATQDQDVELNEFPEEKMSFQREVRSEEIWFLGSGGIESAIPEITISLVNKGEKVINPTITNIDTDENLLYQGDLEYSQSLTLKKKGASLDHADVTGKVSGLGLMIPRKVSNWRFSESLIKRVADFDEAVFDESVFAIPPAVVRLLFKWVARKPATIELRVAESVLRKAGMTSEGLEDIVKTIKAAGVRVMVKVKS